MLKIERTEVFGFEAAFRGMRNPLNSWDRSDSNFEKMVIGENDLNLAKRLISGGTEHRKFLRQIQVWCDITAPFYWWKEADTYKVGTVANSCSTMHKFLADEFTEEDFSIDNDLLRKQTVEDFNNLRILYLKSTDKEEKSRVWKGGIQMLPCGYNQMRTVSMNYENLRSMYHQRKNHKLTEWSVDFCDWVKTLPYAAELIIED